MKPKYFIPFYLLFILASCGSSRMKSKKMETKKPPITANDNNGSETISDSENIPTLIHAIRENALDFLGTRYKYGGTTKKGMDCSGLIYTAFQTEGVPLPRTAREMSLQGDRIGLKALEVGDLLFFQTNKNHKVINHVGMVTQVEKKLFIHSSTSRGVIISSLEENYWKRHFVMARRME